MDTHINYTLVGLFVILLFSAIILSIIWLASGFSFEKYSIYKVYMQESVSGLSQDAPVEYNGVDVGTVKSIELNRDNPQLVELLLRIKHSTPVTQGTVATLNSRGVTGITYIALKDRSTNLRPLSLSAGEDYPIIKTAPSLFVRLDTALNTLSDNLHLITQSIQSVLDKKNQRSIKSVLRNLDQVTSTLVKSSQKVNVILENTSRISQQFYPITYQLIANLNTVTQTFSDISSEVKQNPAILIRGRTLPSPLGPGEK